MTVGPLSGHQLRKPTRSDPDARRQLGDRRRFEELFGRATLVCRVVLTVAISRMAEMLSPPRSKKESSIPTGSLRVSTQDVGVDTGQDFLDRASRGAVRPAAVVRVPATRGCPVCRWESTVDRPAQ